MDILVGMDTGGDTTTTRDAVFYGNAATVSKAVVRQHATQQLGIHLKIVLLIWAEALQSQVGSLGCSRVPPGD